MSLFRFIRRDRNKPSGSQMEPEQTPDQPVSETEPVSPAMEDMKAPEGIAGETEGEPVKAEEAEPGGLAEVVEDLVEEILNTAEESLPATAYSGYKSSDEHLWDELSRINELVRAQTMHWLRTIAADKDLDLWGMAQVSLSEVERFLHAEFAPKHQFSARMEKPLRGFWRGAESKIGDIAARVANTPPSVELRLKRLKELFGLQNLEQDVLLVCLLPQVDSRYRRLFGYLQDDASRTRPSVELVLEILHPLIESPDAGRELFDPQGALIANNLLALGAGPQGDESLLVRPVGVDDRIVGYLFGSQSLDVRLVGIVGEGGGPLEVETLIIEEGLRKQIQNMADWWRKQAAAEVQSVREPAGPATGQRMKPAGATFFLYGPNGSPCQNTARVICGSAQPPTPLLEADTAAAMRSPHGFERVVQLAFREAALRGAALYWRGCEALLQQDVDPSIRPIYSAHWDALAAAAEGYHGLSFLSSTVSWDPAGRFHSHLFLRLPFPIPAYEVREKLWLEYLGAQDHLAGEHTSREVLARLLANNFQLTEGQVIDSVATARQLARARDPDQPRLTTDDLFEGCRKQSGRGLTSLARRLEARSGVTFDDLKLPLPSARQLYELRQRIRNRERLLTGLGLEQRIPLGRGLVVLFTGSSGTGKTMAAELLAAEMHVDLYKVDLSAVVNKYIGETEKNLARLFDEAEEMNACLLMDEADALFGKRGEVKDASDRYANMQVNYLLQRIESYQGVVILATNLRQNIDEAFMRRMQVSVDFPAPGKDERFQIWMGLFPNPDKMGHPTEKEIGELALQFEMTGGQIRNAVLSAAYRALADAKPDEKPNISMRHLVLSIASEFQKSGKPVTRGAFGVDYYTYILNEAAENASPPPVV